MTINPGQNANVYTITLTGARITNAQSFFGNAKNESAGFLPPRGMWTLSAYPSPTKGSNGPVKCRPSRILGDEPERALKKSREGDHPVLFHFALHSPRYSHHGASPIVGTSTHTALLGAGLAGMLNLRLANQTTTPMTTLPITTRGNRTIMIAIVTLLSVGPMLGQGKFYVQAFGAKPDQVTGGSITKGTEGDIVGYGYSHQ